MIVDNKIICKLRREYNSYIKDYFLLHKFFQLSIEAYPQERKKVIPFSNLTPHILLLRLFDQYDEDLFEAIKKQSSFHKLTYKFTKENENMIGTYYYCIINERL